MEALAWIKKHWTLLESLIWSVQCCGCGRWDLPLCSGCAATARGAVRQEILDDEQGLPTWPVLTLGEYEGVLRRMVLAAKHDRVRDLSSYLYEAGMSLGTALAAEPDLVDASRIWVVPAPSSRKRRRERAEIVPFVAEGVAAALCDRLPRTMPADAGRAEVVYAVKLGSVHPFGAIGGGSQRGKGARRRGAAKTGTMRLAVRVPRDVRVVVVDDVCASGATLREVLRHVGPHAVAIAVIAVSGKSRNLAFDSEKQVTVK